MTTQPTQPTDPQNTNPQTDPPTPPAPPPAPDPAQLREQLAQAEARLAQTRRRHNLETALREAGAIDVEAAAILIEALRDVNDTSEPQPQAAVASLKSRRPYLFRAPAPTPPSAGSAMSPAVTRGDGVAIHRAAEEARNGDPNAVLRYMRLRREVH